MSFENRFVVDVFVRLSPFLDSSADNHVLTDQPQAGDAIPDLCLKLRGVRDPVRIEAKWIEQSIATNVTLTKKQIRSWQARPNSTNFTPHLWIARRPANDQYFLVAHEQIASTLANACDAIGPKEAGENAYSKLALPGKALNEAEFWREFWVFVSTLPREL